MPSFAANVYYPSYSSDEMQKWLYPYQYREPNMEIYRNTYMDHRIPIVRKYKKYKIDHTIPEYYNLKYKPWNQIRYEYNGPKHIYPIYENSWNQKYRYYSMSKIPKKNWLR